MPHDLSAYSQTQPLGTGADLEAFVLQHKQLVRKIALHIKRKLPMHIALDDLLQSGLVGLLEARQQYRADGGSSFETWASIRIRGAIIDALRRNSWLTRDASHNMRLITDAIHVIEQRQAAPANANSIASELGVSVDKYYQMAQDSGRCHVMCLDDLTADQTPEAQAVYNPENIVHDENLKAQVKRLLPKLPEREQLLLSLYYVDEFTFKQIAEILEVTEARISQLHRQAVARLRELLFKKPSEINFHPVAVGCA